MAPDIFIELYLDTNLSAHSVQKLTTVSFEQSIQCHLLPDTLSDLLHRHRTANVKISSLISFIRAMELIFRGLSLHVTHI